MIYPLCKQFILKKDNTYTFDLSNYYFANDALISSVTLCVSSLLEKKYYFTITEDEVIKSDTEIKFIIIGIAIIAPDVIKTAISLL